MPQAKSRKPLRDYNSYRSFVRHMKKNIMRGSKYFRQAKNAGEDFTGNNEGFIYMAMGKKDLTPTTVTTEDVMKAKKMADASGNPITWRRGDPVDALPDGIRQRIEKALIAGQ